MWNLVVVPGESDSETELRKEWNFFAVEGPDSKSVCALRKTSRVRTENHLLVDSGAFAHCAPETFGTRVPLRASEVGLVETLCVFWDIELSGWLHGPREGTRKSRSTS